MACKVKGCRNRYDNTDASSDRSIRFFSFPKDAELREKWFILCGVKKNEKRPKKPTICSVHFEESAYHAKALKNKLGNTSRPLQYNALPTLHLPAQQIKQVVTEKSISTNGSNSEASNDSFNKSTTNSQSPDTPSENESKIVNEDSTIIYFQKLVTKLTKEKERLQKKHKLLVKFYENALKKAFQERDNANSIGRRLAEEQIREKLRSVFTETQIQKLLGDTNRVVWTDEDLKHAMSIYDVSPTAYEHLQINLKYPLPCYSSLMQKKNDIVSELRENGDAEKELIESDNIEAELVDSDNIETDLVDSDNIQSGLIDSNNIDDTELIDNNDIESALIKNINIGSALIENDDDVETALIENNNIDTSIMENDDIENEFIIENENVENGFMGSVSMENDDIENEFMMNDHISNNMANDILLML